MKISHIVIGAVAAALLTGGTAVGTTYVTGSGIADETITAQDLGPDVTRIKSVAVTIPSEEPMTEERCSTDDGAELCADYILSAATTKTQTIRCPGGNVTGGGVHYLDDADMANLTVQSYPANDSSWTYKLYNDGPDPITVQLRIVCI